MVALLIRDGHTYRARPDLGTFDEDVFESVFVEIERSGGLRNDIVGTVHRPPRGDLRGFTAEMARVLQQLHGTLWVTSMLTFLDWMLIGQGQTFWEN